MRSSRAKNTGLLLASVTVLATVFCATAAFPSEGQEGTGEAAADIPGLDLVTVSPTVVMAENSAGSNLTCVALEDGLVFVDAGLSTSSARAFRAAMEERFGRPTRALVLTHAHMDHVLGMGAFEDVEVIAAAAGRPIFQRLSELEFDDRTIAAYTRVFPTFAESVTEASLFVPRTFFDDETRLGPEGRGVLIRRTGGHSLDSSHIIVEDGLVVIGGDLVQVDRRPYFGDATNDLGVWVATLKSWKAMGAGKICPGHGRAVDSAYLQPIWEYFEALMTAVAKLKGEGVAVQEVVSHPSLPAGYWTGEQGIPAWWGACVMRVYESV